MPAMALAAALLAFSMVSYKERAEKKNLVHFKNFLSFLLNLWKLRRPGGKTSGIQNFENIPDFRNSGPEITSADRKPTFKFVKSPASWKENVRNLDLLDFENIPDFWTGSDVQTGSDFR